MLAQRNGVSTQRLGGWGGVRGVEATVVGRVSQYVFHFNAYFTEVSEAFRRLGNEEVFVFDSKFQ